MTTCCQANKKRTQLIHIVGLQSLQLQGELAGRIMGIAALLLGSDQNLHLVILGILPKAERDVYGRWSSKWPNM